MYRRVRAEAFRAYEPFRYCPLHALFVGFAATRLRREANGCKSIDDCVELAFNIFRFLPVRPYSIRPSQVKAEIATLLRILRDARPRVILEVGTFGGGTLFLFTRVASPDALIISVDLPGFVFGGGYPRWRIRFLESFAIRKQKIVLIRRDSHAPETLAIVERILQGRKLDLLFVDGDHTYDGVRNDYETYSKLVRKSGIVAFHDICPSQDPACQVNDFWNRVKHSYEHIEIVSDWNQRWGGIGVLYV